MLWDWAVVIQKEARTRLGLRRGDQLVAFLLHWAAVQEELGHRPTYDEYIHSSHVRRAEAEQDKALFAEVFPQYSSPSDLLDALTHKIDGGVAPTLFD